MAHLPVKPQHIHLDILVNAVCVGGGHVTEVLHKAPPRVNDFNDTK